MSRTLLVTGGAGFIGSEFVRSWANQHPEDKLVVLDALTYAGNRANLDGLDRNGRVVFVQGQIQDDHAVENLFSQSQPTHIVNFAAETHVDRSVLSPTQFIQTNVLGTGVLLEAARRHPVERFVHVSTDEVYGQIEDGAFRETDPLEPRSPYAAAKAGSDLLVLAHANSYGLPAIITRGSNTYGPYQFPEKLIPFFVTRALRGKKLPLYGSGNQVRDWIHVSDHAAGVAWVLLYGAPGEVYNIGGGNEAPNHFIASRLIQHLGIQECQLVRIEDPRGAAHDQRYALDTAKLCAIGWRPQVEFEAGLRDTVEWYRSHEDWWRPTIESDDYLSYVQRYYGRHLGTDV